MRYHGDANNSLRSRRDSEEGDLAVKVVLNEHLLTDAYLAELAASFPSVTFRPAPSLDEQLREIGDAEVFCAPLTPELFRAATALRWVHYPGTGVDWAGSVPEFVRSDVVLTNARGPHAEPMADHLFAMLLTLTHHMRELAADQHARRWEVAKYYDRMVDLHGRTMGIYALGGIGRAVARRAAGFGLRVVGVDARADTRPEGVDEVWVPERLDDLLRASDIFVVAAPLTDRTRDSVDRRRVGLLHPGSYFFVISRGGIVDEAALADSLEAGTIAGAGLDVTATEPLPPDNRLWRVPNLILTPHVSAYTPSMLEGRRRIFKENLRRYLAGEPLLDVCDKEAGY
jgi:phosphoglycerate dehydrogenase-like enzyme